MRERVLRERPWWAPGYGCGCRDDCDGYDDNDLCDVCDATEGNASCAAVACLDVGVVTDISRSGHCELAPSVAL